jgi:hypothetical protein
VRVVRKTRLVVGSLDRLEVIEQQERIQVIEPAGADAAAQMTPAPSTTGSGLMTCAIGREDWLM